MRKPESFDPSREKTHRSIVLTQIDRCNRVISSFDVAQEVTDELGHHRTFIKGAQEGKAIALSIRVLLSVSRKALPKEFFNRLKVENKYKQAFEKKDGMFQYLSENPNKQYEAIMKILDFYDELLAAIFSLEDFSDIKFIRDKKEKTFGLEDDEEDLFEINP